MLLKSNSNPETILQIKNLRLDGISKENNRVNLDLKKGEIHAIMGESGAGKTGLAHILAGLKWDDQSLIYINQQLIRLKTPFHSLAAGIGVLFHDPIYSFIPRLTVKEFLYIWGDSLIITNKLLYEKTQKLLGEYEIQVNPNDLMVNLNPEERRLLSLMKLLARNPLIVVLDEPSSDLSEVKKQQFFRIIRKYAENEKGVLYLSNKLDEILQIGDRVTILKDGGTIECFPIDFAKKKPQKILNLYFGREEHINFSDDEFKEVIDTLLHTTELLTSEYELQDLLNLLVSKISETTKADGCSILLLDESSANVGESFRHWGSNLPMVELKDDIVRDIITSGKPFIINSISEAEVARLFVQPGTVKAFACMPIRVRSKINGAIEVFFTQKKNFTQEDIELMMTFATQVAIAIENTRLLGRSTLLKEAHHRIKNNLQSIISLLILQLQTKSKKSLDSIVWQIIDRIKTIAGVHEILSQDERGIGLVNFHNLVKLIIANFKEKDDHSMVETIVDIDDFYISYRVATSLGLVVNELLANCFEHAFPQGRGGKISLSLHHDEERVYLEVIDNGVGFNETQPNLTGTLGLSLVKTLVNRDLRGSIEITSRNGTCISVSFPKKQISY